MRGLNNRHGFTLIEVVVTIIVSSILAVLLMQVMKGHSYRSYWPLIKTSQDLALRRIMENITADYRGLLISDLQPLVTLQNRINAGGNPPNGYWSGQTYAASIQIVQNSCLDDIHRDDILPAGEIRVGNSNCKHPDDTLLKVTLAYDGEALTALFSR
jgi:prepilin-type N-terminal cleavage/methylation domain-containing protein